MFYALERTDTEGGTTETIYVFKHKVTRDWWVKVLDSGLAVREAMWSVDPRIVDARKANALVKITPYAGMEIEILRDIRHEIMPVIESMKYGRLEEARDGLRTVVEKMNKFADQLGVTNHRGKEQFGIEKIEEKSLTTEDTEDTEDTEEKRNALE